MKASSCLIQILACCLLSLSACQHADLKQFIPPTDEVEQLCCPLEIASEPIASVRAEILEPVISLSRSACFGECPIYTFMVFKNGKARFIGERNSPLIGIFEAKVSEAFIQTVQCRAVSIGFFDFKDSYPDAQIAVYDAPSVETQIKHCGKCKHIRSTIGAPEKLIDFEQWLTGQMLRLQWLPVKRGEVR